MKTDHWMELIKPYRLTLFGAMFSLVVFTVAGMAMPLALKVIVDKVIPSGNLVWLYALLGGLVLLYAVREIFFYISHYLTCYTGARILFDLRTRVFRHLQGLSLRFYEEYRTGKLISNVITDVASMQQLVSSTLNNVGMSLFMLVFILGALFVMCPTLALISLAAMVVHFFNFLYFKKKLTDKSMIVREKMSEISANLAETINGIKVVKSFAKERTESREFVSSLRPMVGMSISLNMMGVILWIIIDSVGAICAIAVLALGCLMVIHNQMTTGEFIAFYSYTGMALGPINNLSGLSGAISEGLAGARRIRKLLDTVPEIRERENPRTLVDPKGEIEFDNVSFAYDDKLVVKNFSLRIEPGMKVAFVGASGSGKSTIANLLLRFYDVKEGAIKVDGNDIRDLSLEAYRSQVGVVLQESFLFSGTIRENIAYARKEASSEEVMAAARMANVEEFVNNLDERYETKLGENGATLSGGQKQRIAIARAILKDPKILVLDEATSALDTVSERLVQDALDNLMAGRTTLIIAHRLSTIRDADLIVVMENGEIRQSGTHEELMRQEGAYRRLYTMKEDPRDDDDSPDASAQTIRFNPRFATKVAGKK